MGKTTYEQVLTFGKYPYKDKKSFVFIRTNQKKDKNIEFVSCVEKFVKNDFPVGENIWLVGGAQMIASFLKQKIVNEIIVTIIPILLGKGISLFQNFKDVVKLEHIKTEKYGETIDVHYKILK